MSEIDARLVHALTDIATVGVLQERALNESASTAVALQTALNSRIRIEQAKGVVAERLDVNLDDAFGVLRGHARRNRLRLSDVAEGVVKRTIEVRKHG